MIMSSTNDANSVFSDRTSVQPQTLEGRVASGTTHNEGINSDQSLSEGEMSEAGSKHSHDSLEEYKSAALHFYDPAMMVSYVYVSGKMVGYVKGAIYRKTTWVLALVAFPLQTSGQGCWVLKGSYGGGDHRRDMISQVSECMTQNTQRGTSARSFLSRFRFSLTPREGEIFWLHLDQQDDPETVPAWIYESPGDRFQRQARQVMEEDEAMRLEEETYRNQIENYLVPTIGGRHSTKHDEKDL